MITASRNKYCAIPHCGLIKCIMTLHRMHRNTKTFHAVHDGSVEDTTLYIFFIYRKVGVDSDRFCLQLSAPTRLRRYVELVVASSTAEKLLCRNFAS